MHDISSSQVSVRSLIFCKIEKEFLRIPLNVL